MTDSFLLLTPILMLGVIALLGFVGCGFTAGVSSGPGNFTAVSGEDGKVDLSWAAYDYADTYHLKRGTTADGHYPDDYPDLFDVVDPMNDDPTIRYSDTDVTQGKTYYYVVTMHYTEGGESWFSGPVSATPAVAVPFSPDVIATKHIWLKAESESYANGASVPVATDKSGHGFNASAVAAAPTFVRNVVNGKAVYRFDGVSQFLQFGNVLTPLTEGEVFLVARLSAPVVANKAAMWRMGLGLPSYLPNADTNVYDSCGASARTGPIPSAGTDFSQFHIYNVRSSASEWTNSVNGTQLGSIAANTVGWPIASKLGRGGDVDWYQGDFAEFFVSSAILSAADRASMLSYFAAEYGITVA